MILNTTFDEFNVWRTFVLPGRVLNNMTFEEDSKVVCTSDTYEITVQLKWKKPILFHDGRVLLIAQISTVVFSRGLEGTEQYAKLDEHEGVISAAVDRYQTYVSEIYEHLYDKKIRNA